MNILYIRMLHVCVQCFKYTTNVMSRCCINKSNSWIDSWCFALHKTLAHFVTCNNGPAIHLNVNVCDGKGVNQLPGKRVLFAAFNDDFPKPPPIATHLDADPWFGLSFSFIRLLCCGVGAYLLCLWGQIKQCTTFMVNWVCAFRVYLMELNMHPGLRFATLSKCSQFIHQTA